jgi:regulator of replication initiation timing
MDEKRRLANRLSAARSRRRSKESVLALHSRVQKLEEECARLMAHAAAVEKVCVLLTLENNRLQDALAARTAPAARD